MLRSLTSAMSAIPKRVHIPPKGVDYRGKVVLAPMVRSGELPSRLLALHYGADLVWGPETVDRSLIGTTRKLNSTLSTVDFTRFSNNHQGHHDLTRENLIFRIHPGREGKKLIFQIGTADPERAVAAARVIAADVAGIDVNAGCPKPFSTSGGMGAALLQTPDKLCAILEALVKEIVPEFQIGISVKIRLLETPELTRALVERLVRTGITALTIHCRTTPMRPRQRAIREQLRMIGEVCHEAGVACLMNGDVYNREDGMKLAEEYGVDGCMIATAAETNPSCFRTAEQGGLAPWREVNKLYLEECLRQENRYGNTKYLLGQMVPGKEALYRDMTASKCYAELVKIFEYPDLEERAKEVDHILGLDDYLEKMAIKKQGKRKHNPSEPAQLSNKKKKAMARDAAKAEAKAATAATSMAAEPKFEAEEIHPTMDVTGEVVEGTVLVDVTQPVIPETATAATA